MKEIKLKLTDKLYNRLKQEKGVLGFDAMFGDIFGGIFSSYSGSKPVSATNNVAKDIQDKIISAIDSGKEPLILIDSEDPEVEVTVRLKENAAKDPEACD